MVTKTPYQDETELEIDALPQFTATIVRTEYTHVGNEGLAKFTLTFTTTYRAYNREEKKAYAAKAYFNVTQWRENADHWNDFGLSEGQVVRISGMPTVRTYTDRDGNEKVLKTPELLNAALDEDSLYQDYSQESDSEDLGI